MTAKDHPAGPIMVELVYAQARRAVVKSLSLPRGASIEQALAEASRDSDWRGLDLRGAPLGIFGCIAQRDHVLQDGDRIEIYRPLAEDPKIARRKRARRSRSGPAGQ